MTFPSSFHESWSYDDGMTVHPSSRDPLDEDARDEAVHRRELPSPAEYRDEDEHEAQKAHGRAA